MTSHIRIRHGSSVDLASDMHAVNEVQRLLSRLDGASSAIRKITAKAAIREFANYYFDHMPSLAEHPDTARALLERLIVSSGNVSWKQMRELKKSSVHALELLGRLLDNETNQNAFDFRSALQSISVKNFRDLKLDKHITSSNSQPDVACLVISIILELRSDITLNFLVESSAAQTTYYEWEDAQNQEAQIENEVTRGGGYFDVKTVVDPVKWSEVDVQELYQIVESFNDPNEDSEENVKKSDDLGIDIEETEVSDPLGITRIDSKRFQKSKTKPKFWAKRLRFKKRSSDEEIRNPRPTAEVPDDHIVEAIDEESSDLVIDSQATLGSSSPYDEDFNPVLFLLDVHRTTPFYQLESGLTNLRKIVNNRLNLMRELVRDNFDEFVSCKDAIDSIHDLCQTEVELSTSDKVYQSNTGAVLPLLKAVTQKMSQLYAPLFQRKDEAERIRHVLAILRRFSFLFNMPGVLQNNIKLQKYDAVVRDYRKLTQIQNVDIDLLKEIIAEIHLIIDRFRNSLLTSLDSPNGNFPDQIRIIGLLFDLEATTDPACYFLDRQFCFICSEIDRLKDDLGKRLLENIARDDHSFTDCVEFVDKMLRSRLPTLWKLSSDFSPGQFSKVAVSEKTQRFLNRFYEHFQEMSSKLCSLCSSLLFSGEQLQLIPITTEKIICVMLSLLEFFNDLTVPQDLICELYNLCRECCRRFIETIFSDIACKMHIPIPEHLWQIDERNQLRGIAVIFSYSKTLILQAIRSICNFKHCSPNFIKDNWTSNQVGPPLLEIFYIILDGIHEAITRLNVPIGKNSRPEIEVGPKNFVKESYRDFQLILILHNLGHCRNNVIPEIWDAFLDLSPEFSSSKLDNKLQEIISLTLVLEQLALDSFLKSQTLSLNEIVHKGVLLSGCPWDDSSGLQEVRGYVYEILIKLVFVHDQLSSVGASSNLADNIVSDLLFQILIAFQADVSCIDKFSSVGCEQLLLEIEFIEASLVSLISHRTEIAPLLRQIKSHFLDASTDSKTGRRSELLQSARASSSEMFITFQTFSE